MLRKSRQRLVLQIFDARRWSKRGKHLIQDGLVESPFLWDWRCLDDDHGNAREVRSSPSLGRCCCTKRWAINVKMLIIDEIHHVFAGPLLKQRHFLNVIKYMGNELKIPIAAAGTHDAFNAIQIDPHSPIGSSRRSCHAGR
jgi:Bacterial TniB protein